MLVSFFSPAQAGLVKRREFDMKRTLGSFTILFLGLAAIPTIAPAQEPNGLVGVWFAEVIPIDCSTRLVIPNAPVFRGLYMFGHDGSLTNEAAFPVVTARRSSGLGAWQHTQAQMYNGTFRFFRYSNADGTFQTMRKVTTTIVLNGDHFISFDLFQDFDADNNPISGVGTSGCNAVTGTRQQ